LGEGINSTLANFGNRVNDTDPVGSYPDGATSEGVLNMAGNVWEWTLSLHRPYPYDPGDGRNALDALGNRVGRGGSWDNNASLVRTANRTGSNPDINSSKIGFRCAASVQP